jgi:hypothetical protein
MNASVGVYRPRHPENTPFYRCLDDYWDEFQRGYEVLFEKVYGPLRRAVTRAVGRFLKCGVLHFGFARLLCAQCGRSRYLAYSCRTRQFCPSCAAKRVAAFADWAASEVLEAVCHRQGVFTIPKVLRGLFRRDRRLLGKLCRCGWETLVEMYRAAFPEEDVMGAAVIAIQTAGDQLQWRPHLHALVPDAVWTRDGRRLSISYLDPHTMTRVFQAKVLRMLVDEHRLTPEFAARLLSWRHSGFQVYRAEPVEPDDAPALERLCAYIGRAVFASTRVEYDPTTGAVSYRTAKGAHLSLDALEWIALVTQHIPNRGEHTRHYFGYYSNAARGKRKKTEALTGWTSRQLTNDPEVGLDPDGDIAAFRRESRRNWARLIQRVYEVDPLACECGGRFEIIAFIDAPHTIRRILEHLHLWALPARPPPAPLLGRKMDELAPGSSLDPESEPEPWCLSDPAFRDDVPTCTH